MCIPELRFQAINAIGLLIDDRDQKKYKSLIMRPY